MKYQIFLLSLLCTPVPTLCMLRSQPTQNFFKKIVFSPWFGKKKAQIPAPIVSPAKKEEAKTSSPTAGSSYKSPSVNIPLIATAFTAGTIYGSTPIPPAHLSHYNHDSKEHTTPTHTPSKSEGSDQANSSNDSYNDSSYSSSSSSDYSSSSWD